MQRPRRQETMPDPGEMQAVKLEKLPTTTSAGVRIDQSRTPRRAVGALRATFCDLGDASSLVKVCEMPRRFRNTAAANGIVDPTAPMHVELYTEFSGSLAPEVALGVVAANSKGVITMECKSQADWSAQARAIAAANTCDPRTCRFGDIMDVAGPAMRKQLEEQIVVEIIVRQDELLAALRRSGQDDVSKLFDKDCVLAASCLGEAKKGYKLLSCSSGQATYHSERRSNMAALHAVSALQAIADSAAGDSAECFAFSRRTVSLQSLFKVVIFRAWPRVFAQ